MSALNTLYKKNSEKCLQIYRKEISESFGMVLHRKTYVSLQKALICK